MTDKTNNRRPRFRRAENPPGMRFQRRDARILQVIYDHELLARRHLKAMFWPDASWRAMDMRLSLLYHNGYLDWPSREQRRSKAIPEPICWLGWKGAFWLAGRNGIEVEPPHPANENQLRLFAARLRDNGIYWQREPRWVQLEHDLAVVDFRLAVEQSISEIPSLVLKEWVPESAFRSEMDVVEFETTDQDGNRHHRKKGVRPDGYFSVADEARRGRGESHRLRFLVEVDMATHDNPSFANEKAIPGAAYMESAVYKERFGHNSGRWLVATTGEVRMRNLMKQTEKTGSAWAFLFTTFAQLQAGNILTTPIWHEAGSDGPFSLLSL